MRLLFFIFCALTFGAVTGHSAEFNTDRPGSDFQSFFMQRADYRACEAACRRNPRCKAYTYVRPGIQGRQAKCWLKNRVPAPRRNNCCISGVVRGQDQKYESRWDKISGRGGAWTTGWVPNHDAPICGHFASGCNCNGRNYCGTYRSGQVTGWWPRGCNGPFWRIRCTSRPQR